MEGWKGRKGKRGTSLAATSDPTPSRTTRRANRSKLALQIQRSAMDPIRTTEGSISQSASQRRTNAVLKLDTNIVVCFTNP
ncbi:hypothetical protein NQZ68_014178 [Dissostichus eleginoides]|nr:hypothetical protein NQZ68_014178 [Dissostichus eleginoides]